MINASRFRYVFPVVKNYISNFIFQTPRTNNVPQFVLPSYTYTSSRTSSTQHARDVSVNGSENKASGLNVNEKNNQVDVKLITNGDPELEKKLKILFLEVEIMRQEGNRVPLHVSGNHWKELLSMNTRSMRRRYLTFLWKTEMKRTNEKQRKLEARQKREQRLNTIKDEPNNESHLEYALHKNTILLRVYDSTINNFYNNKLIQAMQFSQKVVVDCGYDNHMTSREAMNCAKQLMLLFSENRIHPEPFDLLLCNANHESYTMRELNKFIPTLYEDSFPLNVTEKSYLDLFPKENLLYLTPHCREKMIDFDHNTVYIIGGIVDKVNKEPLSLAKAKQEGLKMAQLPLDRYLSWGSGSGKSLTLNQMIQILLELRITGDWSKALQHVPRRKIEHIYEHSQQRTRSERFKEGISEHKYKYEKFNHKYAKYSKY